MPKSQSTDGADLEQLLEIAVAAARQAGQIIKRNYRSRYESWEKSPENPVTSVDLEVDSLLRRRLMGETPNIGWLSEETVDSPARLERCCAWVVDPLDGTSEFIQGIDQFAVSIAYVQDALPSFGVVHNPATGEMMAGIVGQGLSVQSPLFRPFSSRSELPGAQLLVSDTELDAGMWAPYQGQLDLRPLGSAAYKLARLAVGLGDAYVSLKPKSEWDVCAGVSLVLAAGGRVTDLVGEPLLFNQKDVLVNGLIAANPLLHFQLVSLLNAG